MSDLVTLKARSNKGDNPQRSKGKGKGKHNDSRYGNRSYTRKPNNSAPKGYRPKGKGKGRGNGNGKGKGRGSGKPFDGECRQCGKPGHMARDCYSRTKEKTTLQQNQQTTTTVDEATLQFSQFAVHTTTSTKPNPDKEENVSSDEEDKTANEDRGEEDNEIDTIDINASPASQESNETIQDTNEVNQSSDIYNDDNKATKRP